jgi:hypothetical protein
MKRLISSLVISLIFAAPAWSRDGAPAKPANDGLDVCLDLAGDDTPVYPSDQFPRTRELNGAFRLGDAHGSVLQYNWIAVDVGAAAPANYNIAGGTLAIQNVLGGILSLNGMQQPVPAGKYRLDATIDGHPWKSVNFTVVEPPPAPNVPTAKDLLPLTAGKTWTYRFMQEAANGMTLDTDQAKLDPDGRLHATIELKVAGDDDKGSHLELRRNGLLVNNQWWRIDKDGLSLAQTKSGDAVSVIDPPQLCWPWPLEPKQWTYEPSDHSYKQTFRMWGPLMIKCPQADMPGYVVLLKQIDGSTETTVERHYVPGLGLVKEVIISSLNNKMRMHSDMTLTESH